MHERGEEEDVKEAYPFEKERRLCVLIVRSSSIIGAFCCSRKSVSFSLAEAYLSLCDKRKISSAFSKKKKPTDSSFLSKQTKPGTRLLPGLAQRESERWVTEAEGEIPNEMEGTLLRNGPAMYEREGFIKSYLDGGRHGDARRREGRESDAGINLS